MDNKSSEKNLVRILYLIIILNILPFTIVPFANFFSSFRIMFVIMSFIMLFLVFKNRVLEIKIKSYFGILILFFILILFNGSVLSVNPLQSLIYALWLISQIGILFITYSVIDYKNSDLNVLLKIFSIVFNIFIILSLLYSFLNPDSVQMRGGNIALLGIFTNNNTLGMVSLLGFIALFAYNSLNKFTKYKYIVFILLILDFVVLFLTSSRASILSGVVFIILYYLIIFKKQSARGILVMFFGFSLFSYLVIFKSEFIFDWFRFETGLSSRDFLIMTVYNSIDKIPFLGLGIGMQEELWGIINGFHNSIVYGYGFHNSYLQVLIELGVLGLVSFLLIILFTIFSKQKFNINGNKHSKLTKIMFVSMSIHGFFESSLLLPGSLFSFFYWSIIIYSLTQSNINAKK